MFKGRHFDRSVILLCVRWYLAYGLSLRDMKEMMAERGVSIDHSTIHRWVVHFSPVLLDRFNRRKRAVGNKWHMDETYIKVRGQWTYLYRAIDSVGATVEFWFSEQRDLPAAKRFLRKALMRHGRPDRIVIDGSQTNRETIISCDAEKRLRDRSQWKLPCGETSGCGGDSGNYLDLEVEASEPVDTDGGPVRIGRLRKDLALFRHDRCELILGVGMESRHVDDIVKGATACSQRCFQIGKGQSDLLGEFRFRRAIGTASHLAGNE
jgi:transposase-like protein